MFSEAEGLKIKQFGQKPEFITWAAFATVMDIVFTGGSGKRTWEEHYGEETKESAEETKETVEKGAPAAKTPEIEKEPERKKESLPESTDYVSDDDDMITTETQSEEIAPAQENRINSSVAADPEDKNNIEMPQEPEKEITLMQRRRYMATLSLENLADYLSRHLSANTLKNKDELMAWLKMEVEV